MAPFKKRFKSLGIRDSIDIWIIVLSVSTILAYGLTFAISFIPGEKIQDKKEEITKFSSVPIGFFTLIFLLYFFGAYNFVIGDSVDWRSKLGMGISILLLAYCTVMIVMPENVWKENEENNMRESMVAVQISLFLFALILFGLTSNNRRNISLKPRTPGN